MTSELSIRENFQSTPLREGRLQAVINPVRALKFSIHAPARGATSLANLDTPMLLDFQSTPLREGRPVPDAVLKFPSIFQSTPLREGRPVR